MTSLVPEIVRDTIDGRSLYSASESFGIVAFILLVVLLLEQEALRTMRTAPDRARVVSAFVMPLAIAVTLTIILRVTKLLP